MSEEFRKQLEEIVQNAMFKPIPVNKDKYVEDLLSLFSQAVKEQIIGQDEACTLKHRTDWECTNCTEIDARTSLRADQRANLLKLVGGGE